LLQDDKRGGDATYTASFSAAGFHVDGALVGFGGHFYAVRSWGLEKQCLWLLVNGKLIKGYDFLFKLKGVGLREGMMVDRN